MARRFVLLAAVASSLALGACFSEGARDRALVGAGTPEESPWNVEQPEPPAEPPEGTAPEAPAAIRIADATDTATIEPLAVTELGALFPPSAQLVGVAIEPDTGRRFVLEARTGLYELTPDGAELVFDLPASRVVGGTGDGSPPVELTDVAIISYLGPTSAPMFALTAENDGFLLSLPSSELTSHFCYLPLITDWEATSTPSVSQELRQQGVPIVERTEAVAISDLSGQIFAQPRTLRMDGGGVAGSELFVFDSGGGQPIGTRRFERTDFVAGGAAFLLQTALVLGSGDALYLTLGWADDVTRVAAVAGVTQITGVTSLPGGNLFVLDGPSRRLLELDARVLAEAGSSK